MTIGQEIPFRRSKHDRDTGSLVLDQERAQQVEEQAKTADSKKPERKVSHTH